MTKELNKIEKDAFDIRTQKVFAHLVTLGAKPSEANLLMAQFVQQFTYQQCNDMICWFAAIAATKVPTDGQ